VRNAPLTCPHIGLAGCRQGICRFCAAPSRPGIGPERPGTGCWYARYDPKERPDCAATPSGSSLNRLARHRDLRPGRADNPIPRND